MLEPVRAQKRIAATLVAAPFALPTDFKGLARPGARLR
jgi:hypothetical protein